MEAAHGATRPTEILKQEHRIIERVLTVLEREVKRLRRDKPVDLDVLRGAVEFCRGFADKCHHGKEEGLLFPAMIEHGIPEEEGPLSVMREEHEKGRRFLAGLAEGIEIWQRDPAQGKRLVLDNASGYTALLRSHIDKEDNILFVMAEAAIPPEKQRVLQERFEQFEREEMGGGAHEKFHEMVEKLEARPTP